VIPSIDTMPPIESENMNIGMPIDDYVEFFKQHQEYYVVLLGENGDPRFVSKLKHSIKQSLFNHMPVKEFMDSVQTDYIIEYMLSGMIGILVYWLSNPNELTEYEIISLMKRIMPVIH
jgi:secreted Zn-dependent insulinase-like peptidase